MSSPLVVDPLELASAGAPQGRWVHRFAWLTSALLFVVILSGAAVTSFGVGMAVADWPTTQGENMFLFPWLQSAWDVFIEHGHRLAASIFAGLMTFILAIWIWLREKRNWVRALAAIAFFAVCLQGILGGIRVEQVSRPVAFLHGVFGQAVFGCVACLALFTSQRWKELTPEILKSISGLRRLALATSVLLYFQILLGAVQRHWGIGLEFHMLLALFVAVHIFLLVQKITDHATARPLLMKTSTTMAILLGVQLLLGIAAWIATAGIARDGTEPISLLRAIIPTLHVGFGALLFAVSLWVTVPTWAGARQGGESR